MPVKDRSIRSDITLNQVNENVLEGVDSPQESRGPDRKNMATFKSCSGDLAHMGSTVLLCICVYFCPALSGFLQRCLLWPQVRTFPNVNRLVACWVFI